MIVAAIVSIILLVPKGRVRDESLLSEQAHVATGPGRP
jgi:hypothetical protein